MTQLPSSNEDRPWRIATFYKFVPVDETAALRATLLALCEANDLRGSILLAPEGINATVAGAPEAVEALLAHLREATVYGGRFADIAPRMSWAAGQPFLRMKVRLKREIVTLGAPEADPARQVGTYVPPEDWNALIAAPDVAVIDTRNDYEVAIGTFAGAADPKTPTFTAFKDYVQTQLDPARDRRVALFCTGGIRCEKATSYLLAQGFEQVYHLEGGILRYLETVPESESTWQGACFVFDERVAVSHGLAEAGHTLCRACWRPLSSADRAHPDYIEGVQCHHCRTERDDSERARARERQRQVELAENRGEPHLGHDTPLARVSRQRRGA